MTRSPPMSSSRIRRAAAAPGRPCVNWTPGPTAGAPTSRHGRSATGRTWSRPGAIRSPPGAITPGSRSRPGSTPNSSSRRAPTCSSARRTACRRGRGGRSCWPPPTPCATPSAPPRPGSPRRSLSRRTRSSRGIRCVNCSRRRSRCRCWWSGSGRCSVPGTSSSRVRRAAAWTRCTAPSPRRRSGCPRSPGWASTSSTSRRSTPSERRSARAPTTPCRRAAGMSGRHGRSAHRRAVTTPCTQSWARSRTSTPSYVVRRPWAWRSPSTSRFSALPTIRGWRSIRSGSITVRTGRSRTRRTRRRSTRTSIRSRSTGTCRG
ncbi:hypothetical protein Save01_08779 [Streptomyces avermitilis]